MANRKDLNLSAGTAEATEVINTKLASLYSLNLSPEKCCGDMKMQRFFAFRPKAIFFII